MRPLFVAQGLIGRARGLEPLAVRFVHEQRRGDGGVQRLDGRPHRNRDVLVGIVDHRRRQPTAFAAHADRHRTAKVGLEHGSAAARHGRDDEAPALPRLRDRLIGGRPHRNREAKRTAHRSPQGFPAERIRAFAGCDHSRRATRFAGACDGADVSGILNVAGDEDQRRGPGEEAIFEVHRTFGDRDDGTRRPNGADGSHDGRRRRGDVRSVRRQARDQRLNVGPIDGVAGDHHVAKTERRRLRRPPPGANRRATSGRARRHWRPRGSSPRARSAGW